MPCRRAAFFSTNTCCPCATASRTLPGAMPTRYSWTLISFGTPMRIASLPSSLGASSIGSGGRQHELSFRHVLHVRSQRLQAARHRPTVGPVDQFHGMGDRNIHAKHQLLNAADIAGRHRVGANTFDVGDLALAE